MLSLLAAVDQSDMRGARYRYHAVQFDGKNWVYRYCGKPIYQAACLHNLARFLSDDLLPDIMWYPIFRH